MAIGSALAGLQSVALPAWREREQAVPAQLSSDLVQISTE